MGNSKLVGKVQKALDQDNTIVTSLNKVTEAKGFTTEYMNYLGLTSNDLKKLERNGLALRGYTNTNKTTKLGSPKSGNQVMWILLGADDGLHMQGLPSDENKTVGPVAEQPS